MNKSHSLTVYKVVVFSFFLASFFFTKDLSAQAVPGNSPAFPQHITLDQRTISEFFTQPLSGSTTPAQWIVRINGSAVGIIVTGVSTSAAGPFGPVANPVANNIHIQFDASGVAGHGVGRPYLLPGETLTIQYTGNTLTTGTAPCLGCPVAAFGPFTSKNFYVPPGGAAATGSVDLRPASQGPLIGIDQCSPVNTNFYRWTYAYSLRYVNSSNWIAADQRINVAWNGPPGTTSVVAGYRSDNAGVPNATFTDPFLVPVLGPVALMTFSAGLNPTTQLRDGTNGQFSYNDNTNICNFRATGFPTGLTPAAAYNGSSAPQLQISHQFDSYDFDDGNTGTLNLDPVLPPASGTTTSDLVCLGTNVGARFRDLSTFNCIGNGTVLPVPGQAAVATPINNQQRWIRFVYGSIDSPTPQSNIRDIRVNGVQVIDNNPGAPGPGVGKLVNGPVGQAPLSANPLLISTMSPTTRGFVVTGAGGPGIPNIPDANGVIELPSAPPAVASNFLSSLITTVSTTNHAVGQRFYVTIQYWNVCNPYPSSPPVETTVDFVQIIPKPAALTTAGLSICYDNGNSNAFNFTAGGGVAGRTDVNWYRNRASVGTATRMTNPNGNNSLNFPASAYGAQGGIGGNFSSNNANGRYHSVWVTQVVGGSNNCESDPVEVVIIQQPRIDIAPDIPSTPVGATEVCNGPPAATEIYTTSAPNTKTIPINTSTNGALINLPTENVWSVNNFAATVTISPTTATTATASFNIAPQPNPSDPGEVRVRRGYVTSTLIPVVSPLPAPFTLPTYNISPQACLNTNVIQNVTVFGQSDGGTITGSPTICAGSPTGNMTLSGQRGAILQWERSFNAGAFVAIAGTAGLTTFSEVPPNGAGTYKYRALVQNQNVTGPCAAVTTIVANQNTVTVNPIPPKPTISASGPTTFCAGGSVTLTASNVGGLAASYRWYKDAVFTGITANNIVLSTAAQSGAYTVEARGIAPSNCVSPLSDPTNVLVNPLPTATVAGGGSVCSGTPAADIVWTLTGTAPFNFTITLAPGAPINVVGHNSTTFTIVAPNPGANTTYTMTALSDANTCSGTSLGGPVSVTIQLTPPPSVQLFTAQAPVCDDGGATNPPDAILDLLPDAVQNYAITYRLFRISTASFLPGSINFTGNSTGAGIINLAPTYAQFGAVPNDPQGYQVVITAIQNTVTLCAGAVPINGPILIINPRPPTPTGAVPGIACSTAITGSPISVNAPPVGFTIVWSSTASPTFTAAAGVTGGTRGNTFTPTSVNTATYHAFTRDDVAPTNCLSSASLPVLHTRDLIPSPAAAGPDQPLLCTTSATLAATAVNNGGSGLWSVVGPVGTIVITTPSSPTSTVTGLPQDVPGGSPIVTTLRWTASSALGVCSPSTDDVILTVNPRPAVTNLTPQLCEDVSGGGTHANFNLTTLDASITGGAAGVTVEWFADPIPASPILPATTLQNITNGAGSTYFVRLTSTAGCQNTGTVTFTVNSLPAAVDRNFEFCENTVGAGIAGNFAGNTINLTTFEFGAGGVTNGGTAVNRNVEWYEDAALTTLIPPGAGVGQEQNYTITATKTIFAKVIDLTSPVTPRCFDVADVTLTLKLRPADNPITGGATVCTGSTIVLYQVNPGLNPGSTYTWSVTSAIADFQVFGGGGINSPNFFILLKFPGPAVGNVDISVFETLNGCTGNTSNFSVTVAGAPGALTFNSPQTNVCKNETGVVYSLNAPNPLSLYTWTAPGASFQGPSSGVGLSSVTLDFTTLTPVTVSVTETSSSGCAGAPASVVVNLVDRPVITSSGTTSVCSGNAPTLAFTATLGGLPTASVNFGWQVINVTGAVTGTTVGNTGTGNLSEILTNNSGVQGFVTYRVTPTETVVPNPPNCAGTPQDVVVTVNPQPVLITPQTKTICSGQSANYEILLNPSTLPVGTTFSWPLPVLSAGPAQGTTGNNVPGGGAGSIHITDVLVNTTASPITATYTITPTSGSLCPGTPQTVVITINPEPTISATLNNTVCSDVATGLTLSTLGGSVAASTYNITARTIAGGLTAAGGNAFVPAINVGANYLASDLFTNLTANPLAVTYTVQGVSALGCVGAPRIITITINPEPVVANGLNAAVCSDQIIGLTLNTNGTSVAAATYNIIAQTIAVGLVAAGTNVAVPANGVPANHLINNAYTNTGLIPLDVTYTVVPVSAANCFGDARIITITINPEPVVSPTLDKTICSQAPIALTLNTNGTSVGAVSYDITAINIAAGLIAGGANVAVPQSNVLVNYLATDTYTNTGNTSLDVEYTVVPRSAAGCYGNPLIITVTIDPEPIVSSTLNASVCSDLATGLTLATDPGSVAASSYIISARTIAGGLTAFAGNAFVPVAGASAGYLSGDRFTNLTASPLNVTYTIAAVSAAGCIGASRVITLSIDPEPVVSTLLDASACSDATIGLVLNTNGSSVAAASYNVTSRTVAAGLVIGGGNAAVPSVGSAANYLANDSYTNTGVAPLNVTYTVVPVSSAGCLGDARIITITINPEPVISSGLNKSSCSGEAIALTLATNPASVVAADYNITAVTVDPGLVVGGANVVIPASGVAANYLANDNYTNTGGSSLPVTYTVVPRSAPGCFGDPVVITVTINPQPVMSAALNATVCSDLATGLVLNTNGTSVGAASYNITARSIAAGLTPSGGNVGVPATGVAANFLANDIFTNTGGSSLLVTYTVLPVSSAGCLGSPIVITITIDPEPVLSATLDANVCSSDAIGLTLNTNGTSVAAASYNISGRTIAPGLTASGGNVVVPAAGVVNNYLVNDIYTNTGVAPLTVTYTVIPVSAAGCLGNPRVISLTIDPEPVVASTLDATVCSDAIVALTLNTNGTSVAAANYNVTSVVAAAGLIPNPANVVIPASGVASNYAVNDRYTNPTAVPLTVGYTVEAVSSVGCVSVPRLIIITINPEPVVANSLDASVCSDLTIGLTLATNGTSVAAANYNIISRTVTAGLTSAGTNVAVPATGVPANYLVGDIFTNTGAILRTVTYVVVPVSGSGCLGDPKSIVITINPEPVVATGLDVTVCSDLAVGIVLNTNGTSVAANNYNVTARTVSAGLTPNGSNAIVPATGVVANYLAADEFTNLGALPLTVTYTVVPVSTAGCLGDPRIITATIDPEPVLSTSLNATICSDAPTALTLNTNGLSVAASTYNITARSIAAGLTAAGTNAAVPAVAVANNYLNLDQFTNTGAVPLNVTYTIEPVSAIGCVGDPVIVTMTISPEPVLSGTLNLTQCSDIPSALVLNTNGTSVVAQNYNITAIAIAAGLTAAGTNAVIPATGVNANYLGNDVFTNTGASPLTVTYTVIPVSAANCQGNPVNVVVTINPEPVVSNTLNATVCSDVSIGLTLNTNGTSVTAANYNIIARSVAGGLTAGAGNAAVPANNVAANYLVNDVYTNTGNLPLAVTYTVIPTSAAGCAGDARIITMTINPEPVVSAGLDATICSDATTGLILNTDGSSVAAASYNITTQSIDPSLTAAGSNVAVPANGVTASYLSTNRYTNTGTTPLLVTYTVVPVSATSCIGNPQVITITVNPEPVIANGLDVIVCSDLANGLVLSTLGTSVAANDYNITGITIPAGLTAAGTNAVIPATGVAFNYLAADSYTNITTLPLNVTYTVVPRSAALCLGDPKVITVTVQPEPVVASNLDATNCSDVAIGLLLSTTGTSVAASNYNVTAINVPGGLVASGSNAVVANGVTANYLALDVFTNTGPSPLDVQYTVVPVSGIGCAGNPRIITITINPEPVISTTLDAAVCSDLATGLTLNTNGVSVSAANFNVLSRTVAAGLTSAVTNAIIPANGVAANYLVNDRFTNTGAVPLTVVYSVNGVSGATCAGNSQNITITINPEPVLANGLNRTVCSDVAGGIIFNTNGTSVAALNYNVTAVSIAAGLTTVSVVAIPATGVAANYLANDIYRNTGNTPLDVTYTVIPVSADGCLGDPLLIKQTVSPEPVLAVLDKTVCSDISIGITLSANGVSIPATTFDITNIVIAGGLAPAGTNAAIPATGVASNYIFNDQFTNPGNLPLTVQYTVVPISAGSCAGNPVVIVVTVDPEPVLSAALDRTTCSDTPGGVTLNTNGVSVAAATYNISNIAVTGGLVPKAGNAIIANGVGPNYLVNDQFTNTTNSSLTVTYSVVPVSATGCLGNPLDVVLTVDPEPVLDPALATKSICSREISNITLNTNGSSVAALNYNITLVSQDAGLTGIPTVGNGLAANAILNDNFTNVTSTPLKVVYQIIPISGAGCFGDPFTITVTVNAEPVVNPALDNTVCSEEVSGIILSTNGTSIAAGTYRLVSIVVPGTITANGTNVIVGSTGGINLIRNDRYSNTTNANAIVTYEIRGISSLGCEGASEFINLTVNPAPIMVPGSANLCSDVPSGIIVGPAAGSATITQFELKNIVKAPALVAGGSNAGLGTYPANLAGGQSDFLSNDTFTNTTNGPLLVTYTIVPIAGGCRGLDQTVVFTVNAAPAVEDNLNKTVCSDEASGIVFATETSPLSVAAASYNITTITIQPGLVRTAGNAAFPRNGVTANDIQADQFRNPTNNPLIVTYGVQAVSGAPCLGPIRNIILTVEPEIIAAPVNNAPSICSNSQTDIDLISPTNPTSGVVTFNYTAVSSVGGLISGFVPALNNLPENYKIQDALVNNSDNPATVTYSISAVANGARNGGGCSSLPPAVTRVVTVDPKPKMIATPSIQTVCEGVATSVVLNSNTVPSAGNVRFELLSATASGGVTGMSAVGTLFAPASSLADVLSNPTVTSQTVTYTFQPKVIGGLACAGDNVVVTITVNPLPTIVASAQPDICSGDFINITLTPDVANTVATWTVSAPLTITGESNGAGNLIFQTLFNSGNIPETVTYTVTPRVNGCNGTPIIISAVVNPKPKFVGLPPTVTVCHGGTLNVPLTSTVAGTTFDWVVDDPSGLGVPLTGSGNVINQPLTNTTGSQASLTYTITPTGPGACPGDQKFMIVAVAPQISAQFLNTNSSICKGSSEFLIIEVQGQAPFQIVYNDGTTDITLNNAGNVKVVQVVPTVTTTYTIKSIKDALNCTFLPVGQTVTVTVGETDANFSIVGPAASCGPYTATFQFNQVAGTEYTWQWFDGSPDDIFLAATTVPNNTISHTFTNPNPNAAITYKVTLRTQLPAPFPGCFKTTTRNVTVFPSIITNAFPDRSDICSGESIQFFNQSFGATTHRWFYRVQGTSTEIDIRTTPSVNYTLTNTSTSNPIIYEVVYQANNGNCPAADVVMPITVYRAISAGFNEGTIPPFIGGNSTVTFTNTSTPIDVTQFRYEWTFGLNSTPATGNGAGPFSVNYSTPGQRDITLKVVNIAAETAFLSCESSFTKTINIPLLPLVAAFTADPVRACFPSDITVLTNTSTGDLMDWRVVDSNGRIAATSNAALPVFRITNPGAYSIFLTTSNSLTGQVANTQQNNFEIFDNPVASFDLRPTTVFVPDTELTTFNFSIGATDYDWDFGDGGKSVDVEPVYIYKVEGAYDVRLIARNDRGQGLVCTDTLIRKVTAKQGGVTKVPNAFTPNPNGPSGGTSGGSGTFNDVFLPIVKGADEFNMQIFDRWGNLIFESNSANVGWDGYNESGKLLPAGVYVYKLTVRLSDGQRSTQIGDVTMIR